MADNDFTGWGGSPIGGHRDPDIVFNNVRVLDATGELPYMADVTVEGSRIKSVSRSGGRLGWRAGSGQFIDCAGMTLMPGLIDAHLHLSWNNAPGINPIQMMPVEEH